jgi:hypothetical protein
MVMCGDGYLVYRCDPCMPGEDDPDFRHRAALWHMICIANDCVSRSYAIYVSDAFCSKSNFEVGGNFVLDLEAISTTASATATVAAGWLFGAMVCDCRASTRYRSRT